MLMRPNKAKTAAHGCHQPGDMIWLCASVRYWPDRGLLLECVTSLFIVPNVCQFLWKKKKKNRVTPLQVAENWTAHLLNKDSKTDGPPSLCSGPLPPMLSDHSCRWYQRLNGEFLFNIRKIYLIKDFLKWLGISLLKWLDEKTNLKSTTRFRCQD